MLSFWSPAEASATSRWPRSIVIGAFTSKIAPLASWNDRAVLFILSAWSAFGLVPVIFVPTGMVSATVIVMSVDAPSALASSMAARNVHTFAAVAHVPSPGMASAPPQSVELTTSVTAAAEALEASMTVGTAASAATVTRLAASA